MNLVTSIQRIGDVMSQEPQIYDKKNASKLEVKGEIEFQNVSFGYKSYQPVLEHINLKVKPASSYVASGLANRILFKIVPENKKVSCNTTPICA